MKGIQILTEPHISVLVIQLSYQLHTSGETIHKTIEIHRIHKIENTHKKKQTYKEYFKKCRSIN
jgi:hypothetical protein